MRRGLLLIALLFPAAPAAAQSIGPAAQFSDYHVKPGTDAAFLKGYRDHLAWHLSAKDRWPWYVWVVVTGERTDTYVGGSFDHDWAELERRPRPAEDSAHEATIDPHLERVRSRFLERRVDLGGGLIREPLPRGRRGRQTEALEHEHAALAQLVGLGAIPGAASETHACP